MELPRVSLSAWDEPTTDRRAYASAVARSCHEVGFLTLVDHGITRETIDEYMAMVRAFFALPESKKALIEKVDSPYFRGWERVGSELTDNRVDHREQVDLSSEHPPYPRGVEPEYLRLQGPNRWPADDILPGFSAVVKAWFATMEHLATRLMEILAVGLELPAESFVRLFGEHPHSLMKLIHYPPTPEGEAGVNWHHDAGFLTILLQHEVGGLQVLLQNGDVFDVPVIPGTFVLNVGEMLQAMTGNYYVATKHRVVSGVERYSSAFFHGPDLRTSLAPLDLNPRFATAVASSEFHRSAGFMARREELVAGHNGTDSTSASTYGEQLWNYYRRSYPDIVARHSGSKSGIDS